MSTIVDPDYVDQLALEVVTLNAEVEQMRCAVGQHVVRDAHLPATDPIFKASCKQLAEYIERRTDRSQNLIEIAIRYGKHCVEQGGRLLVGKEFVVYQRFDKLTIVICADNEEQKPAPKENEPAISDRDKQERTHQGWTIRYQPNPAMPLCPFLIFDPHGYPALRAANVEGAILWIDGRTGKSQKGA